MGRLPLGHYRLMWRSPGAVPGAGGGAAGYTYTYTYTGTGTGANGGHGGKGMVIVTWTAPGGTALAASLSSAATTDPLGNAVPVGFQGSIVAVEPASSPSVPEG